eukprot:2614025-Amphidinium_carterae.2
MRWLVRAFREALKQTRDSFREFKFEDWQVLLGKHIPVCDTQYAVREDDLDVHGKTVQESVEVESASASVSQKETQVNGVTEALDRLTKTVAASVENMTQSVEACLGQCVVRLDSDRQARVEKTSVDQSCVNTHDPSASQLCGTRDTPVVLAQAANPEKIDVQRAVTERIESYLLAHGVPTTASRTNLGKGQPVRSLLLGLYTRRGVGITRKTGGFSLLQELHELAKTCVVPPAYTSITINVVTDSCVQEHRDVNNVGISTVFVCGVFTGGAFRQGCNRICVKQGWFQFQGQVPHEVEQVQGTRISIVYFTPMGFQGIPRHLRTRLVEFGFPYEQVMSYHAPMLLTSVACKKSPRALSARTWSDFGCMRDQHVLIEYACYEDSLLSAAFELEGGLAVRLGLPDTDLTSEQGREKFRDIVERATEVAKGVVLWVSIPCSSWSSLQQLNVQKYGSDWLGERQLKALPLVHAAIDAVKFCLMKGGQVVWEWPHRLCAWKLPEVEALVSGFGHTTRVDACAYGFQHKGVPCKKPWLLKSSMPLVRLERLCACTTPHIPCEGGSHVSGSARYTESMARTAARSLLSGLRKIQREKMSETLACASEPDEDESDDDRVYHPPLMADVSDPDGEVDVSDDGDDDLVRELFGEEEEDEVVNEETSMHVPDSELHVSTPLNPEAQLLHEESGHYPKSPYCPICQLSDGTVHRHKHLKKNEVGMVAVDLAGPFFPDRVGEKYALVAVWVGHYNHKAISLPFVELISSRLAVEVFEALTRVRNQLENLVSSVLPAVRHDDRRVKGLRIMRLHTDRASEFLGIVSRDWARENHIHATQTGSHSPESNGRAECCIRVVKSLVRRSLLASGLSTEFWGYSARHAGEMLRAHSLRKAGDKMVVQPLPFGSVVAVRRPGQAHKFRPFEGRGKLGKLILHETGTRRCFILDGEDRIWKGFSAERDDFIPDEYIGEGWTKIKLVTGRHAWFHPENGLFRLTQPPILDDTPLERVIEEGEEDLIPTDINYELDLLPLNSDVPEADSGVVNSDMTSVGCFSQTQNVLVLERKLPDTPRLHEMNSPDVLLEHATSRSTNEHGAETPTENEEGYCCGCGRLVWQMCGHVVEYCPHYTCLDCRVGYHYDGVRVWACIHHPELPMVESCKKQTTHRQGEGLCSTYSGTHGSSCAVACSSLGHAASKSVTCALGESEETSLVSRAVAKRVSFKEPLIETWVEFEVESISLSTSENAKRTRCLGRRNIPRESGNVAVALSAQPGGAAKSLARKRREAQALQEMPDVGKLALCKAVPITAEAVRNTKGTERGLWKTALQSELASLDDNRVFYKITADRAQELQRAGAASVPARLVLVLKPDDGGFKRKARIVACGNFIGQYEAYDVSNLDAAVFRAVLQVAARKEHRVGVLDIRTAFLNAEIEPGRMVIVRPPGLLKDFGLQNPGEAWVLCKALYGLRESPGLWAEHRDNVLKEMTVVIGGVRYRWLQCLTHSSVWLLVAEKERLRVQDLRRGKSRGDIMEELSCMSESEIPDGFDFPLVENVAAFLCVYV